MSMDILSWNCRGIGNPVTVQALRDLVTQNRPQIVFLMETKISKLCDFKDLQRDLGFAHAEEVLSEGQSGGLGLFWNDEVDVHVRTSSAHHIDMEVRSGSGEPWWRLTGFYGYPNTADRDRSWQLIRDLCDMDSLPWVIIGDFNEILNNGEKTNGPLRPERQMRGFRDALGYSDLVDLGFQGVKSTWWNSMTQLRLDRAVATLTWSDIYGYHKVKHLAPSDSDHIPILLQASTVPLPKRPKRHRFKFESFWLQHEDCDPLVMSHWQDTCPGVPMFKLTQKIINTRQALESWQQSTFRLRQQHMFDVRGRLEFLMGEPMSPEVNEEKKSLMITLQALLMQEEAFWKQRAKITWLQEGDRNSGFFHRKAANRKRKNNLLGLFDVNGQWRDDDEGMENVVTDYLSRMFTASVVDVEAINQTLAAIQPCVTSDMNQRLCASYTEEEVRTALFQMYPTKSPGPDGMPPLFFQHYWDTIRGDVTEAVQSFLHIGSLLKQINFTHICLIPKVDKPDTMGDLRPIALCNVIYKLCSKVIANRLKVILQDIISPFQSAFVPGRLITDNILVANEVAHYVHNKREEAKKGYMALKLDLSKAYDRMEWDFLRQVMLRFGFAQSWIDIVMQCVCSVQYSFIVRGKPRGLVVPSRGLRQGDPLSPYLFLIGAEGFSALLQQKQRMGLLPGIAICRGAPRVNHLLFADDSMLYAQATPDSCFQIQEVIRVYGKASGQVVNFHKSSVAFSKNVSSENQVEMANLLGMEVVDSHEKYLGLPTYVGRKKTATFAYIKERLADKLNYWQGKLLSGAGKDILIRVVAQALPTYAMSVFQLTKNFCEDLEQMCARFWWGSTTDKRKIHWKNWDDMCHAKEDGGLGFRSLTEFNMSMLAKQAWRVVTNPGTLIAQLYKARYFPEGTFWDAPIHSSPSYSWRSILASRELLKEGSLWQIGNGASVSVMSDAWIPSLPSHKPQALLTQSSPVNCVSDLIIAPNLWDEAKVRRCFVPLEADAILSIPLSTRSPNDRLNWSKEQRGMFTVKSAYRHAFSKTASTLPPAVVANRGVWKKIWQAKMPSSAKVNAWKIGHNILPTLDRLASRHVNIDSRVCVLCNLEDETIIHLCRNCCYTREVLNSIPSVRNCCFGTDSDNLSALSWLNLCSEKLSKGAFAKLLFFIWGVWKERNSRVWDNKITTAYDVALLSSTRLGSFIFYNSKVPGNNHGSGRIRWSAPPLGWVKINCDGAYNNTTGKGAVGGVVRDEAGQCMGLFGKPLNHVLSAEHAELLACKEVVQYAQRNAFQPVIFETDCLIVKQQLGKGRRQNLSTLGRLYDDLYEELLSIPNVKLVYARREANRAAHMVATHAVRETTSFSWFSVPPFLFDVIVADSAVS